MSFTGLTNQTLKKPVSLMVNKNVMNKKELFAKNEVKSNDVTIKSEDFWRWLEPLTANEFMDNLNHSPNGTITKLVPINVEQITCPDDLFEMPALLCEAGKKRVRFTPAEILDYVPFVEHEDKIIFADYYTFGEGFELIPGFNEEEVKHSAIEDFNWSGIKTDEPKGPKVLGKIELPHTEIFNITNGYELIEWEELYIRKIDYTPVEYLAIEVENYKKGEEVDILYHDCYIYFFLPPKDF